MSNLLRIPIALLHKKNLIFNSKLSAMREQLSKESEQSKNVNLSVGLIFLNCTLAIICFGGAYHHDPDNILSFFAFFISITILTGIFAFAYHDKKYRWVKWLFGILLLITLLLSALFWYASELGKGFNH